LEYQLEIDPKSVFVRSGDGRGPLFWACEYRRQDMIDVLLEAGVPKSDTDKDGVEPCK